jgi:hypothetical protein
MIEFVVTLLSVGTGVRSLGSQTAQKRSCTCACSLIFSYFRHFFENFRFGCSHFSRDHKFSAPPTRSDSKGLGHSRDSVHQHKHRHRREHDRESNASRHEESNQHPSLHHRHREHKHSSHHHRKDHELEPGLTDRRRERDSEHIRRGDSGRRRDDSSSHGQRRQDDDSVSRERKKHRDV